MGRPYASELHFLPLTYDWAIGADVSGVAAAISVASSRSLVATGSGGSLTAAHFASFVHQLGTRKLSKAVTPLDLASAPLRIRDLSLFLFSAGGANSDILRAFEYLVVREPRSLLVMCWQPESPLSRLARSYRYVDLIAPSLPSGKDGFLAANSLLAFSLYLLRGYKQALSLSLELPRSLGALLCAGSPLEDFARVLEHQCAPLWEREHLLVLYGPSTYPAAIDLESKFSEAALGAVQLADYRNFAHGRHHWLAKRMDTSAVLSFISDEDVPIAQRTLDLLPAGIPSASLRLRHSGPVATLEALANVLYLVRLAGQARGIDPGKPGVPVFGRRIYGLPLPKGRSRLGPRVPQLEAIAIERKADADVHMLEERGELSPWRRAYASFVTRARTAPYGGIVFDYDGTLCDRSERHAGLSTEVLSQLSDLLRAGICIGIATGRGRSVGERLREAIPEILWPRVVIGYYSGSENVSLGNQRAPDNSPPKGVLARLTAAIERDFRLARLATCAHRPNQISIEPRSGMSQLALSAVEQIVYAENLPGVSILASGHSIDILGPDVSKRALVAAIRSLCYANRPGEVLCIGDRGRWPGNDFALLLEPFSLSVDEASPDPDRCWNLAPPGHRGVQATIDYLEALRYEGGALHFKPESLGGAL